MAEIAGRRALRIAQKGFKAGLTRLFRGASDRAGGVLLRYGRGGPIDARLTTAVQAEVGGIVQRLFVSGDGRTSIDPDGRPLSPYARLLLWWIAWTTREAVRGHEKYMLARLPESLARELKGTRRRPVQEQTPPPDPLPKHGEGERRNRSQLSREQENGEGTIEEAFARLVTQFYDLRIFVPNPLAEVDPLRQWVPAHRWTDARGYNLSDRIWVNAFETRRKIDQLIADALRTGQGSLELSRLLEQFLVPGRAPLRTEKPYGTDASYDAMRLARTEIARAHNHAAWLSAYLNPYVDAVDVARSPWGDPTCPICPQHATIGFSGERLRPPYPIESADLPPWHPHDMCNVRPVVTDNPAAVTARLEAAMEEARAAHVDPYLTPAAGDTFVEMLLGEAIYQLLKQGSGLVLAGF